MVRLIKYWNVNNGRVYSSYDLENHIINQNYMFCNNLKDYFYNAVEGLQTWGLSEYKVNKVSRLKDIVQKAKYYERNSMPISAEEDIRKIIP